MSAKSLLLRLFVSLSCFSLGASPLDAQIVDYARLDIGPATQRVEPGNTAVGTGVADGVTTNLPATGFGSLTGDAFTVAIEPVTWRDLGDSTSSQPLVRVGEDFITSFGTIVLTLGGLQAGEYQLTSYHINVADSENVDMQVRVTDALGSMVVRFSGPVGAANPPGATRAERVNNLTSDVIRQSSAVFSLTSNGTDPAVIYFEGIGTLSNTLNGLTIQTIPEPAVPILLAGIVGMTAMRRTFCRAALCDGQPRRCKETDACAGPSRCHYNP